jgi:dephospho-CoA kinase
MLKRELDAELVVIAIVGPRRLRYSRLAMRIERPLTFDEAEARDIREIDALEKGGPIAIADYVLMNDRDTGYLLDALDVVVDEVGCQP